MSRLLKITIAEVQADRLAHARAFSTASGCVLVLKGERTLIAFPDGTVWVNPTGSPAMATGGTGDVLTGIIAGLLAQQPAHRHDAIAAGVYLHGLAGELGGRQLGEAGFIASDLFEFLPHAMEECRSGAKHLFDPHHV
jgi:NAD(P)H-hydrate epimerase